MTLPEIKQEKSDLNGKIVSIILEIKDLTSENKFEIAQKIGVKKSTIYRGVSGKGGSEQLLVSLNLYLDNIKLRNQLLKIEKSLQTLGISLPNAGSKIQERRKEIEISERVPLSSAAPSLDEAKASALKQASAEVLEWQKKHASDAPIFQKRRPKRGAPANPSRHIATPAKAPK